MKQYEITILGNIKDFKHEDIKTKVGNAIVAVGGENVKVEEEEERYRLAYLVRGHEYADKVFFTTLLNSKDANELSRRLEASDEVLRYLILPVDNRRA